MTKADRLDLHQELLDVVDGKAKIYFQPPSGQNLSYPCVIYESSGLQVTNADDDKYLKHSIWNVTVITKDPDSELPEKIFSSFLHSSYDQVFVNDHLYHHVMTIYK